MRGSPLLLAGVGTGIIAVGFCVLNARTDVQPSLVFKGYTTPTTNGTQLAKFELRNASRTALWLYYSGSEFPLKINFLERPLIVLTNEDNTQETNVYSFSVGSFFMRGEKVLPGDSVTLDVPLVPGEPASQVGICYYVGRFANGYDFLNHLKVPLLDQNATLEQRGEFYFEQAKRRFKVPKRHEIWCLQPVCYQSKAIRD